MNAPATFDTARTATWADRFEAALGKPGEAELLMAIYIEMEREGEDLSANIFNNHWSTVTKPEIKETNALGPMTAISIDKGFLTEEPHQLFDFLNNEKQQLFILYKKHY